MKLSAPKQNTFFISLILFILAVAGFVTTVPVVSAYAFWILTAAYVLLFLGTFLKGV